ncbi:hypothetical protein N7509_001441 [Penicillium cosmopolitanum]|uniref:Uncharacterized protein n=1 Tax=Penicillium cosmopolitanum TaxID=1131564 RepID=A0A9W9W7A6_9EURO|nr:uncharacterized protein N7509_001441 [Penicillium cosmopolitanum]KAJ5407558.1 hypothetical protein N7509_001441 [Penicillium cosmopolitanum]
MSATAAAAGTAGAPITVAGPSGGTRGAARRGGDRAKGKGRAAPAPVPGAAVPAWGVASTAAAVLGSYHLLVSYRKIISVYLSEHELYFDTKNTDQALLSYVEFVDRRRKELNAKAGSPSALPPSLS